MNRFGTVLSLAAVACALTACEATKSSNPLSPTVAGPIPGVNISAPKTLEPRSAQIPVDQQPVTLLAENSGTSGVRPLTYLFEVATDAGFTNKVFSRDSIQPGDGGRTSLRLPDRLAPERSYFWRVRAQDGANTGPYSDAATFDVFTPIVIEQPGPVAPAVNAVQQPIRPTLVVSDSAHSGPVGAISYLFEVSDTESFANKIVVQAVPEQSAQTSLAMPLDLGYNTIYFWHARAFDPKTNGPWSVTRAFQTAQKVVAPPPTGGGGSGGGDWEKCGSTPGDALSACVNAATNPGHTVEGAFEVVKRIAWLLRGSGGGLLIKNGGENTVSWKGYSFSASRICFPDGHIYKVLSDVPGTNGPTWSDNDFVDKSLYVPAIDPR